MSNNSYYNDQWRIINEPNQNKVSNYSMEFDETNKIQFGNINSFERTDSFSGSIWVNLNSVTSEFLFSKMTPGSPFTGYLLYISSGRLQFIFIASYASNYIQVNSVGTITAGNWNHLAFTYDGSSLRSGIKLYINGIEQSVSGVGPVSVSGSTITSTAFQISGRGTGSLVNGKIDQVCVFDYALSQAQITTLGNSGSVVNPMSLSPKPISAYQLGDQSVDNGANYLVPNNSLQDYVFNFSSNRITIPSYTITAASTVSLWVRSSEANPNDVLLGGSTGDFYPNLYVQASGSNAGKIIIYLGQSSPSSNSNVVTDVDYEINTWYHLAISQTVYNATVYIDGISKGTIAAKTPVLTSMGAYSNGNNDLQGQMSNVAFFNTPLPATGTESIASLYNNGSPPADISSYSGLQRWYKLNAQDTFNGTNWTIKDYAGSNDGTSSGMTSANLIVSDLQHTSGFSPYALDFGGITASLKTNTIPAATNKVTLSVWVKRTGATGSYGGVFGVRNSGGAPAYGLCWQLCFFSQSNKIQLRVAQDSSTAYQTVTQDTAMIDNTWTHVVGVADGTNVYLYINGVLQSDTTTYNGNLLAPTSNIFFAAQGATGTNAFNGQLSNCARWNIGLTQAQITEIYNQGVPSNLNTFSGTAPIGWWQLGSNSSFEGNDWTCLDEIGTDNADSGATAMSNDDIVNGVGYSGNGLGTSSIDIVGDAPYSSGNGLSENMDVLDRVKDTPPT